METKGMSLRSKRAPQFTEVFRYQAHPQEVQEDLEKMSRALTRLKRRRQRTTAHDLTPAQDLIPDSKTSPRDLEKNYFDHKKRGVVEEGTDETQSRLIKPEFRPWSKCDAMNYHHTFQ